MLRSCRTRWGPRWPPRRAPSSRASQVATPVPPPPRRPSWRGWSRMRSTRDEGRGRSGLRSRARSPRSPTRSRASRCRPHRRAGRPARSPATALTRSTTTARARTTAPATTRSTDRATTATGAGISAPGTAPGRFRIDATLGRGGMAVVYLAHDTELGRPVALKLMADHCADEAAFRARFAREAQAAARLSHPNIVQVFDIGEEAGLPFIVMEYVEGETLGDTLARERRVAPGRAVEIARECCAGLACAHAAGLVHRDIK